MKIFLRTLILIILLIGCSTFVFSQTDKRIKEISKIYQEVNKKIAECEEEGETSNTFLTEIVVNKNNGSYPAVGLYKSVVRFYYTFGDREKNPYPNRLLKIMITTNRSAMTETSEFLFNEKGNLIFYFEKKDEVESRIYFDLERPIKILQGEKMLSVNNRQKVAFIKVILGEKKKFVGIFQSSLRL